MADKGKKSPQTQAMISLVWDLGFIFAVPLVVFALLGRYLDGRLDTSPLFFLVGVLASAVASSVGVFFKVRKLMANSAEVEKSEDKDKQDPAKKEDSE